MEKYNPALTENARRLRKNMTLEERILWYHYLRTYPVKFYRQRVIGHYIADFYCAKAKLVIELDGSQHYETQGALHDRIRTEFLADFGLTVLRIPNTDVKRNLSGVCDYIDAYLQRVGCLKERSDKGQEEP